MLLSLSTFPGTFSHSDLVRQCVGFGFISVSVSQKDKKMAVSVHNIFQERKYPFFFAFLVLFICVMILLFTNYANTFYPLAFYSDVQVQSFDHPSSPAFPDSTRSVFDPMAEAKDPELPRNETGVTEYKNVGLPPKEIQIEELKDQGLPRKENAFEDVNLNMDWKLCKGSAAVDNIPCLDNMNAIKALKTRRHMEHRERHCPYPSPHCLVPLPRGYKFPVPWPKSRDMILYDNVPHTKLVDYKKDQNWVVKSGDYLVFPGGGTQFKDGVNHYIQFIEKTLPAIQWGTKIRVILDVGCGVASFGGYLLDKDVITMSFAPKDEHEAQIQFALERGIPATLSVIGTQKLTFPDNGFDLIHCARCRVHWDADGGRPLYELNRILRPGGFFVWSATPVYRDDERDQKVWNAMVTVTKAMCWTTVAKTLDSTGIGLVIYQKPNTNSCYEKRKENNPPLCEKEDGKKSPWYARLSSCLSPLPVDGMGNLQNWPMPWPHRLTSKPPSLPTEPNATDKFYEDTKHWSQLVSNVYKDGLSINWSRVRNVMDMNAGYGGFASALIDLPVWVMNVVPIDEPDTLSIIYDRGLIGMYHDWCESFNTYPRTYDLLHSSFLFKNLERRCDIVDVIVELDRMVRPEGHLIVHDSMEIINKLGPVLRSLHWSLTLYQNQYLVGRKRFWRPRAFQH